MTQTSVKSQIKGEDFKKYEKVLAFAPFCEMFVS